MKKNAYICNMKLSVIIPVFQVEESLERCVNSVLTQGFNDMEVILIDDGSTDRSPAICDELAAKHRQLRVVHQANKGLSAARNTGIALSQGSYITFVDSDDTIGKNTLRPLMEEMEQHPEYDILEYPVCLFYQSDRQRVLTFSKKTYRCMTTYWLEEKVYEHTYAWNKIYRRDLFHDVRFPEGRVFEDAYTLPQLLANSRVAATTPEGMYYYHWNPQGITATAKGEELAQLLESHVMMLNRLSNNEGYTPKMLKSYYEKILNIQIDVCEMTGNTPILPELNIGWTECSTKLFLQKIFGTKGLCKLYKTIHKFCRRSH